MTDTENELEKALCTEIAARSPFTAQQVYSTWEICKSFDILIKAVDLCASLGLPVIVLPGSCLVSRKTEA